MQKTLVFLIATLIAPNCDGPVGPYSLTCYPSMPDSPLGPPPPAASSKTLTYVYNDPTTANPQGVNHIYLMSIDSTRRVITSSRLTQDVEAENSPEWSPDAQKLLYQRDIDGAAVYMINADGTNKVRLSGVPGMDVFPSWSPDGSKIVYVHLHSEPQPNVPPITEIHVADANGCNDQAIFQGVFSVEPRWSVNGRIVFMSYINGSRLDDYSMDASGQNLQRLTMNQGNNGDPVWSPDGSRITFGSDREGGGKLNIFVMNADGTNQVQLTNFSVPEEAGDTNWSSRGDVIAFEHDINGMKQSDPTAIAEVWTMNADGSGQMSTGQRCSDSGCSPRFAPTR